MNLSKRDQKLILILLSVVLFIAAYVGVYMNFNNKTTT
jgi:flagellar basal body-associated protein FliL